MESCVFTWIFSIATLSTTASLDRSLASEQAVLKLQSIQKILEEEPHGDTSIYDVISEMRQQIQRLEQGQHHLKREVHNMKKTLQEVQEENYQYRDALLRAEIKMNGSCSCDVDNGVLRKVVRQCKRHGIKPKSDNVNRKEKMKNLKLVLETLNSTCQRDVKQALSSSLTTTTGAPTAETTPVGPTIMNRLVIATYRLDLNETIQLDIHNDTVSRYPFRIGNVISMCFVEKLQRLLFAQYRESRIIYNPLDSNVSGTLIEGVTAFGMVVDEERELLFVAGLMSMKWPQRIRRMSKRPLLKWRDPYRGIPYISRMSTTGSGYTALRNLSSEDSHRLDIAINTRQREIYVSGSRKVFVLNYEGKILQDFDTGNYAPSLTFDNVRGILYFNIDKMLTKMSMSDKVVSDVLTLPVKPFTLSHYNDTIYYGERDGVGYFGAVQLVQDVGYTELPKIRSPDNFLLPLLERSLIICLVP